MGAKMSVLGDVARSCCKWLTGCRIGGNRWLEPVVGASACSNLWCWGIQLRAGSNPERHGSRGGDPRGKSI